jgi:hypothetical protein
MANKAQDSTNQRYKENREHGVSPSTHLYPINQLALTTITMSSSRHVQRSPERIGGRLVHSRQWRPAQGYGTISRFSIKIPRQDRFEEGPYLSCDQVGFMN